MSDQKIGDLMREQMKEVSARYLKEQASSGWRPIETAPKDGTSVLLCEIDKWVPAEMHVGWWNRTGWVHAGDDYDIVVTPTHWQPLPKPPTPSEPPQSPD